MSYLDWMGIYTDMHSKQVKVAVKDKSLITCSEDEMRVVSPVALQEQLDGIMQCYHGRCFVRPSGTEDVVRIYAEATSVNDVNKMISDATIAINDIVGK